MFRQNKSGQNYRIASIDQKKNVILYSSRLDKTFSANVFQVKFNIRK